MAATTELWVARDQLRRTKIVESEQQPLEDGQIRVAIAKMGLTANNVSYAVSGEAIGYWKYFPAQGEWGKVPGWAMADVVESRSDALAESERLYGFFPMASEVILQPGHVEDDFFMDAGAHRAELPALYNQYRRTKGEPEVLQKLEDERCLLFPLFVTSYVLYDYLIDNDFFGAQQIIIGSVSSKTGFGLAHLLKNDPNLAHKVVGLTSSGNVTFVESLNCCDQIVTYGSEDAIGANLPTAWIDMSGDGPLTGKLHLLLGENMVESCIVGATHWEAERKRDKDLPGAKPKFFFAPGHIAKRDAELGHGEIWRRGSEAGAAIARSISGQIAVEAISGSDDIARIWCDMLDNKVSPSRGIMISL
ncbi:DUF2855 family protein [Altererythrobacter sp. MF3-039]|uniref:DUF2855 family protein n=1 Tax=Altererythrobacter sp. MF3-039 TaxID=3252901 RepID=UPI00390CB3DD